MGVHDSFITFIPIFYMNTENFMDNDQISLKECSANDVSSRVYGTPTIDELRMRVFVRQQEKKNKGDKKKSQ